MLDLNYLFTLLNSWKKRILPRRRIQTADDSNRFAKNNKDEEKRETTKEEYSALRSLFTSSSSSSVLLSRASTHKNQLFFFEGKQKKKKKEEKQFWNFFFSWEKPNTPSFEESSSSLLRDIFCFLFNTSQAEEVFFLIIKTPAQIIIYLRFFTRSFSYERE